MYYQLAEELVNAFSSVLDNLTFCALDLDHRCLWRDRRYDTSWPCHLEQVVKVLELCVTTAHFVYLSVDAVKFCLNYVAVMRVIDFIPLPFG